MQKAHYTAAEMVYKKAQAIDPDTNKACNLALSLIKLARFDDACSILEDVLQGRLPGSDDPRSRMRAQELLSEMGSRWRPPLLPDGPVHDIDADLVDMLESSMNEYWPPLRSKRLPIFEEISPFRDQLECNIK